MTQLKVVAAKPPLSVNNRFKFSSDFRQRLFTVLCLNDYLHIGISHLNLLN